MWGLVIHTLSTAAAAVLELEPRFSIGAWAKGWPLKDPAVLKRESESLARAGPAGAGAGRRRASDPASPVYRTGRVCYHRSRGRAWVGNIAQRRTAERDSLPRCLAATEPGSDRRWADAA